MPDNLTTWRTTIRAVTMGKDAQGEVSVEVECRRQRVTARALSTDIVQASALAYLKAINTALTREGRKAGKGVREKL